MADDSYKHPPKVQPLSSGKDPEPPVSDVDALLPPRNRPAATDKSLDDVATPFSSSNQSSFDEGSFHEALERAQLLAAEPRSQRQFKKNVVLWLLCTLILRACRSSYR